ncbi:MAG: hypothetical protein GY767_22590 [Shimia sp.]|nr:hypothetical protein [Shimia sp.]
MEKVIKKAARYASKDQSRGAICGVFLEYRATDNTLTVTATDGHILYSRVIRDYKEVPGVGEDWSMVVNAKGEEIGTHYPDWRRGIPDTPAETTIQGGLDGIHMVAKAVGFAGSVTRLIRFKFMDDGGLKIHANSKATGVVAHGGVSGVLPEGHRLTGHEIGFDHKLLMRVLLDAPEDATWGFNTVVSATVIRGDDETFVLMPQRIHDV